MNKQARLTKGLVKDLLVFGVIAIILGGGMLYAYNYIQSQNEREKSVEVGIQQMNSQIQSIKNNYDKANVSIEIYKEISNKLSNGSLKVDNETLRQVLFRLKERFRLSQLNLKLEPEAQYLDSPVVANNTVVDLKYQKVSLKLGGMSDVHIYSFIRTLQNDLPGLIKIKNISIQREKSVSNGALFRISKGAIPQAVSAEFDFFWIDLREKV